MQPNRNLNRMHLRRIDHVQHRPLVVVIQSIFNSIPLRIKQYSFTRDLLNISGSFLSNNDTYEYMFVSSY